LTEDYFCFASIDPNFVSSYEFGDKVYFFFREMAVENINCGKVTMHPIFIWPLY